MRKDDVIEAFKMRTWRRLGQDQLDKAHTNKEVLKEVE